MLYYRGVQRGVSLFYKLVYLFLLPTHGAATYMYLSNAEYTNLILTGKQVLHRRFHSHNDHIHSRIYSPTQMHKEGHTHAVEGF
jgi:hypothetical protein